MKLMRCPVNGLRPIQEFAYGGTFRALPDAGASTDAEWADYVFSRPGEPGLKREWWYHIPSGTWFIAERDTLTDEIVQTYLFDGA
jgi:sarcosine oxidase subunit delta